MKRGEKEIVGAPVMIRLITKAMAGVVHVCCLYPGTHRDRGVLWERAGHVFK